MKISWLRHHANSFTPPPAFWLLKRSPLVIVLLLVLVIVIDSQPLSSAFDHEQEHEHDYERKVIAMHRGVE
jgi:hypothetical protein